MEPDGTWLCPTAFDRARLLDMEARLTRPRVITYGAIGVAAAVTAPRVGWWTLLLLAASVLFYQALHSRLKTSRRPEYVVAATVVNAQVLIGIAVALTGGPLSPALVVLLLPIVTLPARFARGGVVAGVGVTIAVLLASTVGVDPRGFAQHPEGTIFTLAAVFGLAAFADALMRAEVEQRSDSVLDPLTGLLNRKALATRFEEIRQQARVTGGPVCLIIADLDLFKTVNDLHGHARGDAVLADAARTMRQHLRSFELLYRLGGEEFLAVLPGVDLDEGLELADRLRAAVAHARPGDLDLTVSLGVSAAVGLNVEFTPMFQTADDALYEAKRSGRNRVVAAGVASAR